MRFVPQPKGRKAEPPPLASWCIAFTLFAATMGFIYATMDFHPARLVNKLADHHEPLQAFLDAAPTEQRPTGVYLTASSGICATLGPVELQPDGPVMYTLFLPSAVLNDFRMFLPKILDSDIDFIALDPYLVDLESRTFNRHFNYWRQLARLLHPLRTDLTGLEALWTCDCEVPGRRPFDFEAEVERRRALGPRNTEPPTIAPSFRRMAQQADERGIAVVVADMPTHELTGSRTTARELGEIYRATGQGGDPQFSEPFDVLPTEWFCDFVHANAAARPSYRAWLAQQIEAAL
ncbi:MAG: hypothetical protein AAFX81_14625 [Pseudomonadota bacterium]